MHGRRVSRSSEESRFVVIVSPLLSLPAVLQEAISHHRAGRLPEAEQGYRAILQAQPGQPDANHNLGVLAGQAGQPGAGLPYLKAALDAKPSEEQYWLSYAAALLASGQAKGAQTLLQKAIAYGFNGPALQALQTNVNAAVQNQAFKGDDPPPSEMNPLVDMFNAGHYAAMENRARLLLEHYPASGYLWKALGAALKLQGKDALTAMQKAASVLPDDAEAHSNLGATLKDLGRLDEALASCRRALAIESDFADAYRNLVTIADALYRQKSEGDMRDWDSPGLSNAETDADPNAQMVSVIICSIKEERFAKVSRMYRELLADTAFEIIRIDDARSLCEGYNRGIQQSRGDLLIFSHDDIHILGPHFSRHLRRYLADYDLIGVAGTAHLVAGSWGQAGWPHLHGWVSHPFRDEAGDEYPHMTIFQVRSSVVDNIQAVDGLFFAARRAVAEHLRFDETTFDGFHFYDLDFSYRAHLAGYKLAVCNELMISHDSTGNFDAQWRIYAHRFYEKHQATLPPIQTPTNNAQAVKFETKDQIVDFCQFFLATILGKEDANQRR
jgi:tetratricopeptide (TPR) repeat protein